MASRLECVKLLSIGPIGGIDATTSPLYLAPSDVVDMSNWSPNRIYQSLVTNKGRVATGTTLPGILVLGYTKMTPATGSFYVAATYDGANVIISSFIPGAVPATLATFAWAAPAPFAVFTQYRDFVFLSISAMTNTTDTIVLKISKTGAVTKWAIVGPNTAFATVILNGAGNLNASNSPYYYRSTYSNSVTNQESSPGVTTMGPISPINQQVRISGVPPSTDPQVDTINYYRTGGTLSQWLFLGSTTNIVTHFDDNAADTTVSGRTLVQHRDPPPGFTACAIFKERLWGWYNLTSVDSDTAGIPKNDPDPLANQSALWFSNDSEPWGFDYAAGQIPVALNPGSLFANPPGDVGLGLANVAGMLVAFKTKSAYAVQGDDPTNFSAQWLFGIGLIARLSLVEAAGLLFWLSMQGVFSFDGVTAPNYISKDLKQILDSYSRADLAAAIGFYRDQVYSLSFPTQNVTWEYYLQTQKWFRLPYATNFAYFDPENSEEVTASNLTAIGEIDSWYSAETDLGLPQTATLLSKVDDAGSPETTKRYMYVEVVAPVASGILTVVLQPNPGGSNSPPPSTLTFDLSKGPVQRQGISRSMIGAQMQVSLSLTTSTKVEIQSVTVWGNVKREFSLIGPG